MQMNYQWSFWHLVLFKHNSVQHCVTYKPFTCLKYSSNCNVEFILLRSLWMGSFLLTLNEVLDMQYQQRHLLSIKIFDHERHNRFTDVDMELVILITSFLLVCLVWVISCQYFPDYSLESWLLGIGQSTLRIQGSPLEETWGKE